MEGTGSKLWMNEAMDEWIKQRNNGYEVMKG